MDDYLDKFTDLLEGHFDENVYFNMPSMFIPNLNDENILNNLRRLKVVIALGKDDPFFSNNIHLEQSLRHKRIESDFHVWDDEAHRPRYWLQMVQLYI